MRAEVTGRLMDWLIGLVQTSPPVHQSTSQPANQSTPISAPSYAYAPRTERRLLGSDNRFAHGDDPPGGPSRLLCGVDRRGVRLRRRVAAGVDWRADAAHPPRHRHHADARAHPCDDGHDGDDARPAFGRAHVAGVGAVGAAGGGRVAWPTLRQAAGEDARVRPYCAHHFRAQGSARLCGRVLPGALHGG